VGVGILISLDTHLLLRAVDDSKSLSRPAASVIRRGRGRIRRYGALDSSLNPLLEDVIVLPMIRSDAALAAQFPRDYSGDPADRIIGGTARAEALTLITHDEKIRRSPLRKTVW